MLYYKWIPMLALLMTGAAVSLPAASAQPPHSTQPSSLCLPVAPAPSGITDRPSDDFYTEQDYSWMHSSTHLQGLPAIEKYAPGFYEPASPSLFRDFRTSVVVNNTSTTSTARVDIEYYDQTGVRLGTTTVSVAPNGYYSESASILVRGNGHGSVRVRSVNGVPIVGATVHHASSVGGYGDPDPFEPGATSLQQMQVSQSDKHQLWWGPIPVSNTSTDDFMNGILPFFWIVNPNPNVNPVTIVLTLRSGQILNKYTVALQPYGSYLDLTLWDMLLPIYISSNPPSFDDDITVHAYSEEGLPIIGEGVMSDFFGDNDARQNLEPLARFRWGSTMMANSPASILVNPELVQQVSATAGPQVFTVMGVVNTAATDIGPVLVQYRDRDGKLLASDSLASFPSGRVMRIGALFPDTPNYPSGRNVFSGWVRVVACDGGLVGWSMRHVEGQGDHFRKVWGEALDGVNGEEPGEGFQVTVGDEQVIRKIAPIDRVAPRWDVSFPSYTTFLNDSSSNIGEYDYRFFMRSGADVTDYSLQPFAGLEWGHTSFTYEDGRNTMVNVGVTLTVAGTVDHARGAIRGIDAIGDPIIEWDLDSIEVGPGDVIDEGPGSVFEERH